MKTMREERALAEAHRMQEWQVYALDWQNNVVWAGPKYLRRLTGRKVRKIQRAWQRWRAQYLKDNPGKYPLRTAPAVHSLHFLRIGGDGRPCPSRWFDVNGKEA